MSAIQCRLSTGNGDAVAVVSIHVAHNSIAPLLGINRLSVLSPREYCAGSHGTVNYVGFLQCFCSLSLILIFI